MNNFETQAIRTQIEYSMFLEHSSLLYLTSSFVFEDAEDRPVSFVEESEHNIYNRFSNPNTSEFFDKICNREGAESRYAYGAVMPAIFPAFAALLNSGDHIVSCRSVFGSTHSLFTKYFPKWNIATSYFKISEVDSIEDLIQSNTKVSYAETPTNPSVDLIFEIYLFSRNTGPALSLFNAWVLSKSLETLAVRVDKHCSNATKVAKWLENHDKISMVKYPFLTSHPQHLIAKQQMKQGGTIVAFEIKGGIEAGRKFLNKIELCSLSANLGDSRTIVTHPASTTHSKLSEQERLEVGITEGLVRGSVGLENVDDIIKDLYLALN